MLHMHGEITCNNNVWSPVTWVVGDEWWYTINDIRKQIIVSAWLRMWAKTKKTQSASSSLLIMPVLASKSK